ncbi:MAG: 3-hydroxyacyl-CoA dehydrogenase family protein [Acidobacteriota bacterium]|nr:3-hydroxyacyl-CoA dehydrogenase family protein [Acidobacteriota bacterium]
MAAMTDERDDPFEGTIGIIGAGAKGRQIAAYALLGRCRVILEDISQSRLAEARSYIAVALHAALAQEKFPRQNGETGGGTLASLSTMESINDVARSADFLIEAAPEDEELQLEIFTLFDKFAKPEAVLASTAESISIADLAEMTNCPERCVGLQFSEPTSLKRAMQIIRAPQTSERTLELCLRFGHTLGLQPVIVSEAARSAGLREARSP